ncbi:hypothetical protein ACS0TY_033199 [Phlomoides rotata]
MESSTSIEKSNQRRKRCCYYGIALSSIRPAEFYRYLAHNAGGEDRVGHTMKDHKKFVNHEKMKNIEGGNAKTFMELIQKQEDEETNFFYKVQMNEEGRLLNIFWRDSMMQEDFGIYGDVVAGWYKANVDGSVSSAPGCMHVGVLFRNSRGFFVGAFYTRTGQGYPMEAELAAILHLILYAHSQGWHSLWVESNSTLAIDTVLRKISLVPWRLQGL